MTNARRNGPGPVIRIARPAAVLRHIGICGIPAPSPPDVHRAPTPTRGARYRGTGRSFTAGHRSCTVSPMRTHGEHSDGSQVGPGAVHGASPDG